MTLPANTHESADHHPALAAYVPLAVVTRSDRTESIHHGAVVGVERDGSIAFSHGDPHVAIYPRSSLKPMQATAMVRAGLDLPDHLLAIVCASHDGSAAHLAAVRSILASAGLDESWLCNTADYPLDPTAAEDIIRAGGNRTALQMNCSGKHAGMLATCITRGWAHDGSYLDLDHPLQQSINVAIGELSEGVAHVGIDGCGAPTHMVSLVGLARAFAAIASGSAGEAGARVHQAMTSNPVMVGGGRRDVTLMMQGVTGLMAKDGADGVFAAALPDGRAVALKVADGSARARPAVMRMALTELGIDLSGVHPDAFRVAVLGHGQQVGEVAVLPGL